MFGRLAGAARKVIALGARLKRTAPPQPRAASPENKPLSSRSRASRRPRAAAPAAPAAAARPGWFARWFRRKPQPANPPLPDRDDTLFTPETHPAFTPEICALLNTRVEDCDPDLLLLVVAAFARSLAESLPPELGLDARALFSTIWDRLGPPEGESQPEAPPAEQPPPAPATAKAAKPDAPVAPAPAAEPAHDTAAAFCRTAPVRTPRPVSRSRAQLRRKRPRGQQRLPPRRLCYAACAGPP